MGQFIDLHTEHAGRLQAYVAQPAEAPKGAVVLVQEIFGVNAHIRGVADGYAADGYLAIAPALFDPVQTGVELNYDAHGRELGLQLVAKLGLDRALAGVQAAAAHAAKAGRVAVIGYCWGGSVAYLAAIRLGLPAVSYYGGRNAQLTAEPARAPLQFHYALRDAHIGEADREQVRAANPAAEFYLYDAEHGFNCEARASYHAPSAALARERALQFLAKHVA